MWQPLTTANQLNQGSRLRQTLLDGNFRHETIYTVTRLGRFYFMAQTTEQDGRQIPNDQQTATPYRTNGVPYYGFEIWTE